MAVSTLATAEANNDAPTERMKASPPRPSLRRMRKGWLLAFASYTGLAALGFLPVWVHWSQQLNGCNCWDQLLQEWFVQWTPAALAHGHSVLTSNYMFAPSGINIMWNTSNLAVGVAAAPFTETLGVVHTFDMLLVLSISLSATAMFALLQRWVRWWPAAFVGGLVYGFSGLVLTEVVPGRFHLAFDAIPPLLVLVLIKLIEREWTSVTAGVMFGVLFAVQLFASEEILAIMALFAGAALCIFAIVHLDEVRAWSTEAVRCAAAAASTFVVLSAYPLYVQFAGPDRLSGPPQPPSQLANFSQDLVGFVIPRPTQWLNTPWTDHITANLPSAATAELTSFLGVPLLVIAVAAVVVLWRRWLVRTFALVGFAALLCSLGPRVLVDRHNTGIPGPDAILVHLPIVADIGPSRFTIMMWFSLAVILAVALDEGRSWLTEKLALRRAEVGRLAAASRREATRQRSLDRRLASVGVLGVAVVVLLPLVPSWPIQELPANVPSFFTSSAVNVVPQGSLAVTYPYPLTATAWPMLWQADTNMRFRMLGGYAIAPDATGAGTFFAAPNPIEYCLLFIYTSRTSKFCNPSQIRSTVRRLGVTSVIADDSEPNVALARSVLQQTFGVGPRHVDGVSLWRCVTRNGAHRCTWT